MKCRHYWLICQQVGKRQDENDPILHQTSDRFESQKMLDVLKKAEQNGGVKVYAVERFC